MPSLPSNATREVTHLVLTVSPVRDVAGLPDVERLGVVAAVGGVLAHGAHVHLLALRDHEVAEAFVLAPRLRRGVLEGRVTRVEAVAPLPELEAPAVALRGCIILDEYQAPFLLA